MVNEQKFRLDLYYRLNVFPIRVSPLRERPEDIPLLVRHFVQQFSRRMSKGIDTIPSETMTALMRYQWPGNVRELQNVIERAVIVSIGSVFRLPMEELQLRAEQPPVGNHCNGNLRATLKDAERQEIIAALEKTIGKIGGPNGAAALLGMSRSTLQFRMRKLGISTSRAVTSG
jgi:formate hydrogenlyase transcriptional activator